MIYELTLEGGQGQISLNGKDDISSVEFVVAQESTTSNDKSDRMASTIKVTGRIRTETKEATRELSEWSRKLDTENVYKTLSIIIKQTTDTVLRDIYMKNMFCVSYTERFSDEGEKQIGLFELCMRQKTGHLDTIKVEC